MRGWLLLSLLGTAHGWDTKTNAHDDWRSLYPDQIAEPEHNEHALLADRVMGIVHPEVKARFGLSSAPEARVDLHASWIRHGEVPALSVGDVGNTPLEERALPPVAMYAGLPDVAYSLPDWIGKQSTCPPFPSKDEPGCYAFGGWLGAGLNSTHFGSLATRIYGLHHQQALAEARRVSVLYTTLADHRELPDGTGFHADALREGEELAMTLEITGQHFLQDRWSSGHMWSRWGAGMPEGRTLEQAQLQGLVTGVFHGSQAVFDFPDPMCTPDVHTSWVTEWRYEGSSETYPGIGDEILPDLFDGTYEHWRQGYTPLALEIEDQRVALQTCSAAGMRQVIGSFAQVGEGYGVDELPLGPVVAGFEDPYIARRTGFDPSEEYWCTDAWVTNASLFLGGNTITSSAPLGELIFFVSKAVATAPTKDGDPSKVTKVRSMGLIAKLAWRAMRKALRDPDGVDGASTGSWGEHAGIPWRLNDAYEVPYYYGAPDIADWDDEDDDEWLDRSTVSGLYHQAHSEWWCETLTDDLSKLRDAIREGESPDDHKRLVATCATIAMKDYRATDPTYDGAQSEVIGEHIPYPEDGKPDSGVRHGETYEPICRYLSDDLHEDGDVIEGLPYHLHPGYVAEPGKRSAYGDFPESLEHWCERIPVLDRVGGEDADIVGRLAHDDGDRFVELVGQNLGLKPGSGAVGSVFVDTPDGEVVFDVFDPVTGAEAGGWSGDTRTLDIRVPLAADGVPSLAEPGMLPHEIIALGPALYPLQLLRPTDGGADGRYQADGAGIVGTNLLAVEPSWVDEPGLAYGAHQVVASLWVTFPEAVRGEARVLAQGFYRVLPDGTHEPMDVPFTWTEGGYYEVSPDGQTREFVASPDEAGVLVEMPGGFDPSVWDGSVSFFFAYD